MNKKVIAMMIVPIMLTLSGAMAYSAFTGSITNDVGAGAGTLTYSENINLVNYFSQNTNMTAQMGTNSYVLSDHAGFNPSNGAFNYLTSPLKLGSVGPVTYTDYHQLATLNVSNMAPGNWVEANLTIVNQGSVGFIVGPVTISVNSTNHDYTGTYYEQEPSVSAFMSGEYNQSSGMNYIAFSTQNTYSPSINVGGSYTISVYLGLGIGSDNEFEENIVPFVISASITSDP